MKLLRRGEAQSVCVVRGDICHEHGLLVSIEVML